MKYIRPRSELLEQLDRQRSALISSCEGYDRGNTWEAARLATVVYLLVHDGKRNSRSLLGQLGVRGAMRFLSTGEVSPGNLLRDCPLVMYRAKGDGTATVMPLVSNMPPVETKMLQVGRWWDQALIFKDGPHELTRRRLVFALRNQDGGAHVDAELTEPEYVQMAREQFSTPKAVFSNSETVLYLGEEQATMRQIAQEMLQSLDTYGPIA